jgi:hypothetical protein
MMPRANSVELNVRSAYARVRAHELALLTGLSATQVVEEALRGFVPAGTGSEPAGLVRRGPILVKPAAAATILQVQADEALEEVRDGGREG